jgi:hypothetical protein
MINAEKEIIERQSLVKSKLVLDKEESPVAIEKFIILD